MRDLIRRKIVDSMAEPVPVFTRRDVSLPKIARKAIAVIGVRRAGKSTFLWQGLADRLARGTERDGLLYLSFDDDRLAGMTVAHLDLVLEEYYALHPAWRRDRRATFFLDEIQNVPGWESFVRRVLETESVDVFLSGSSAKLLSREVATSMRGRAMEAIVHPFSFREALRHAGREPRRRPSGLPKAARSALEHDLTSYLSVGGFPESQGATSSDRAKLLLGYVDMLLLRDVVERHAVSHPVALRWMVRHLLGNPAGSFTVNRFAAALRSQGIPIGKDALYADLDHLTDAFLIRVVSLATDSERRRMVNPRKVYPIDPGLIPLFDRSGRANLGHALETVVAVDLERRGAELTYVRTVEGHEVDFLARFPEGDEALVQVAAEVDDAATLQREVRALQEAAAIHPHATRHLVVLHPDAARSVSGGIEVHGAAAWLLREPES